MSFRFIDSSGKEVFVPGVLDLALAMQQGYITDTSLVYLDEESIWVQARHHPVCKDHMASIQDVASHDDPDLSSRVSVFWSFVSLALMIVGVLSAALLTRVARIPLGWIVVIAPLISAYLYIKADRRLEFSESYIAVSFAVAAVCAAIIALMIAYMDGVWLGWAAISVIIVPISMGLLLTLPVLILLYLVED